MPSGISDLTRNVLFFEDNIEEPVIMSYFHNIEPQVRYMILWDFVTRKKNVIEIGNGNVRIVGLINNRYFPDSLQKNEQSHCLIWSKFGSKSEEGMKLYYVSIL